VTGGQITALVIGIFALVVVALIAQQVRARRQR